MKILIVCEDGAMGKAIARQIREGLSGASATVHLGNVGVGQKILEEQQPFNAVVVCHVHWRDLLAAVAKVRPRTGLILYSTHPIKDGCPAHTATVLKPAPTAFLCLAIQTAIDAAEITARAQQAGQ